MCGPSRKARRSAPPRHVRHRGPQPATAYTAETPHGVATDVWAGAASLADTAVPSATVGELAELR